MSGVFFTTFSTVFQGVFKIFLIAVAGGILVRRRIIGDEQIQALSAVTVTVLLPCLILSSVVEELDLGAFPLWWLMPIAGIAVYLTGTGIAALLFYRELPEKRNMLPLAGMHNASYLVLPLGKMLYPEQFDRFAVYCFLFVLGVSPVLWSLGKFLTTADHRARLQLKEFVTPPFCSSILAVLLVLTHTKRFIPAPVLESVGLLGTATVPVATFVLGSTLGGMSLRVWPSALDIARVVGVKFVAMPVLVISVLSLYGLKLSFPLLADFFVIGSACPAAVAVILQVRKYGGDTAKIGSMMLLSYVLCMIAIPFWLALWRVI